MSELFCVYNKKKYQAEIKNSIIEIVSDVSTEGFDKYVDVVGRIHNDLFIKKVKEDEVDIIYKEEMLIRYQDKFFNLFSDKIIRKNVIDNSFMIWTNSEQLAKEFQFQKEEQFVFVKYITKNEFDALKIVRKPVLKFKDMEVTEEIIMGDELDKWLSELV